MTKVYDTQCYPIEFLSWVADNWKLNDFVCEDELETLHTQWESGRSHGPGQRPPTFPLGLIEMSRSIDDDDCEVINYMLYTGEEEATVLSFQVTVRDICIFDAAGRVVCSYDRPR